jgi:hypothetical protein
MPPNAWRESTREHVQTDAAPASRAPCGEWTNRLVCVAGEHSKQREPWWVNK